MTNWQKRLRKLDPKERKTLASHLEDLAYDLVWPQCSGLGICNEMGLLNDHGIIRVEFKEIVCEYLFPLWPEYSGSRLYPVPGRDRESRFSDVRAAAAFAGSVSLWEGAYGCARKRLCLFIAEYLRESLEE